MWPSTTTSTRRFEFVGGGSDKFWEITTHGAEVTVRFGRNGTQGQTTTKTFPDTAAVRKHADNPEAWGRKAQLLFQL